MAIFDKDSVHIAGRKVPLALLGVVVGGAGLVLLYLNRKGQVTAGAAPSASAVDPTSYAATGLDYSASLQNLNTSLQSLEQQVSQLGVGFGSTSGGPPPAPTPETTPAGSTGGVDQSPPNPLVPPRSVPVTQSPPVSPYPPTPSTLANPYAGLKLTTGYQAPVAGSSYAFGRAA